jgi:CRP-like cAMP-binding protein
MSSLAAIPALRMLAPTALKTLAGRTRTECFAAGAVLRPVGEVPHSVMFLLSGTVVATHTLAAGVEVWPAQWTGPAIVDKAAALAGHPPATGLMALTKVSLQLLPLAAFLDLLEEEHAVRRHVLAQLARDAVTARRRFAQIAALPALAQIAIWLTEQDPDRLVAWRGSQEQLARVLGVSRVTVNRALARLTQAGAVQLTAHGIVIADRARLATFARD